jgi:protease I
MSTSPIEEHSMGRLNGKRVAVLVTDGFEEVELTQPVERLRGEGAVVQIVAPKPGEITSWVHGAWGAKFGVDVALESAAADAFDALLLPGGVINPDRLRRDARAVDLVRAFYEAGKPIAAICHGPWMLVEAGVTKGLRMTSFSSIRTDVINAGADWVDEPVVVDRGIVTSRKPDDIPAFNDKLVEEIAEGHHERGTAARPSLDELALATRASI